MEFIQWAESNHNYEMFRPMPLYQTLAEQQYKDHMNSAGVCLCDRSGRLFPLTHLLSHSSSLSLSPPHFSILYLKHSLTESNHP